MCIIKDIVLNRCKAYNTAQLVVFMVEIFDFYMRQWLVDIALSRQRVKAVSVGKIPVDAVKSIGGGRFSVQSEFDPAQVYDIDLTIGMCSCTKGENGAICKHQTACADYSMTVVPQTFTSTSESRQWLAVLAISKDKTPNESFFRNLTDVGNSKLEGNYKNSSHENVLVMEGDEHRVAMPCEDTNVTHETITWPISEDNAATVAKSQIVAEALVETTARFGNSDTQEALNKFLQHKSVKSTNQFNSLLHCMESAVANGGAGRSKIPCHPTSVSRRSIGTPRGAAPLCKGR